MDRDNRGAIGARAEQFAFRYLLARGLRPVARNFRTRRGEVDLVMRDGKCLAFIEVRCRNRGSFVDARYTVDTRKQRKLASCASVFLLRNPAYGDWPCRFDVVGVDRDEQDRIFLHWLRDAFRP